MVCGQSGLGKTSLVEHLLLTLNELWAKKLIKEHKGV